MSSEAEIVQAAAEPPSEYDFSNWSPFYQSALRYHKATRPNDQRVIDRIETFRKFMSPRVLESLGGLVLPHPRYNSTEGWDRWVTNVMKILGGHDKSIGPARTVDGLIAQFRVGKTTERGFWRGLDVLVGMDEISSEEQRNVFWNTLSWEAQQRLAERCPYFDPSNKVWTSNELTTVADAEQRLSQIMELSKVDEQIQRSRRLVKRFGLITAVLAVLGVLSLVSGLTSTWNTSTVLLITIPFAVYGLFALGSFVEESFKLRRMRKEQREFRAMETV